MTTAARAFLIAVSVSIAALACRAQFPQPPATPSLADMSVSSTGALVDTVCRQVALSQASTHVDGGDERLGEITRRARAFFDATVTHDGGLTTWKLGTPLPDFEPVRVTLAALADAVHTYPPDRPGQTWRRDLERVTYEAARRLGFAQAARAPWDRPIATPVRRVRL